MMETDFTADYTDHSLRSLNQHSRVGIFTQTTSPRDEATKAEILAALGSSVADMNGSPRCRSGQRSAMEKNDDPFVDPDGQRGSSSNAFRLPPAPGMVLDPQCRQFVPCQPVHRHQQEQDFASRPDCHGFQANQQSQDQFPPRGAPVFGFAQPSLPNRPRQLLLAPSVTASSRLPDPGASIVGLGNLGGGFGPDKSNQSRLLARLTTATATGVPTAQMALHPEFFPFIVGPHLAQYGSDRGVVKISNIPFTTTRSEIAAFIGRNQRMLNDADEPIHIMTDRTTNKTLDAYVEFLSDRDAMSTVSRHEHLRLSGRSPRLGSRVVEIAVSSQAALMADLFRCARGITWNGCRPTICPANDGVLANFRSFVTHEELTMLSKHAESPDHSPFSKESVERPFESMISLLRKFPWRETEHITSGLRHKMYQITVDLVDILGFAMDAQRSPGLLNQLLLKRLVAAGVTCHGFSTTQKDDILYASRMTADDIGAMGVHMPPHANCWNHMYTLVPRPGAPDDLVEYYISLIRKSTEKEVEGLSLRERNQLAENLSGNNYWGYFWRKLELPEYGDEFDQITLAELARRELDAIESILLDALTPHQSGILAPMALPAAADPSHLSLNPSATDNPGLAKLISDSVL